MLTTTGLVRKMASAKLVSNEKLRVALILLRASERKGGELVS
jgi:hypothetical protein